VGKKDFFSKVLNVPCMNELVALTSRDLMASGPVCLRSMINHDPIYHDKTFFSETKLYECGFWASIIIVQVPRSRQCQHEERPTRAITVQEE
jgi:hypothetical protein